MTPSTEQDSQLSDEQQDATPQDASTAADHTAGRPREIGGPNGPEPTRYGDWERNGRCTDF